MCRYILGFKQNLPIATHFVGLFHSGLNIIQRKALARERNHDALSHQFERFIDPFDSALLGGFQEIRGHPVSRKDDSPEQSIQRADTGLIMIYSRQPFFDYFSSHAKELEHTSVLSNVP